VEKVLQYVEQLVVSAEIIRASPSWITPWVFAFNLGLLSLKRIR